MKAHGRNRKSTFRLASLGVALWALTSCVAGDGSPDPSATPGPTESPVPAPACPVPEAFCEFAAGIESALRTNDPSALENSVRVHQFECPFPRPSGAGGPYPLCEIVQGPGETRFVVGFANHSAGVVYPPEAMLDRVWKLSIDEATDGCDWRVRAISCEEFFDVGDCRVAAIALAKVDPCGAVASVSEVLVLKASIESGLEESKVNSVVAVFARKDASIAFQGGEVDSPGHVLFFTYRKWHVWDPP